MPDGPNLVRLSRLVKPSKLSGLFSFLDPVTDGLLGKVYFKNLSVQESANGDSASYNLDIVLPKAAGVEILGSGMALVLNPSAELSGTSEFNVSLEWKLPVLAYIPDFDPDDFSFSVEDILDLILQVFQTSTEDILQGLADLLADGTFLPDLVRPTKVFNPLNPGQSGLEEVIDRLNGDLDLYGGSYEIAYDSAYEELEGADLEAVYDGMVSKIEGAGYSIDDLVAAYFLSTDYPSGGDSKNDVLRKIPGLPEVASGLGLEDLVDLLNEVFALTGTPEELVYGESWTYEDLVAALEAADITAIEILSEFIVGTLSDPGEILQGLVDFFLRIVRHAFPSDFTDLLTPYFATSVNDLALGLEFPRSWLIPLDADGNPIEDEDIKSTLIFNIGRLSLSTTEGLTFDSAGDFDFPASEIAGTGLSFSVTDLELDLSETENIDAANADSRPVTFKGVSIGEVEIGLPKKWEQDDSEGHARIVGTDLVIGSEGGFSGTLSLDTSESSLLRFQLPGEVEVGLDAFSMSFFQNTLNGVSITGHVTLPALKDPDTGEDGEISIEIGYAAEVYSLSADASGDGIPLKISGLELYFKSFGIEFSKSGLVGVDLSGKMTLPGLKDSKGDAAEVDFVVDIDDDGWKISAMESEGVKLTVPAVVDIVIYSIEIGRRDKKIYIAVSADFDLLIDVPVLGDLLPDKILLEYFKVWQDGTTEDVEISVEWKSSSGVEVSVGNGEIAATIPINKTLFNVATLTKMDLILNYGERDGLDLQALFSGSIALGPIIGSVEKIGLGLEISYSEAGGNIGPLDITPRFVPPKGIGVAIDAGVVKGGGYIEFDPDNGRYVGMMELTIQELVSLKAIGILTTQLPDGSKGVTFFILITAEFSPLPLGFGFTLNGVGGLAGINRSMALDIMQSGLSSGALDNILFPQDVVANAARIISDIEELFPIEEGRYVFGPMGIIGWGAPTLISLEFGLMLEVPNPIRLAILGVLKMALPTEETPVLELNVAFLGIIDFEQKYLSFDASIYDSRVLTFTLEGDMALRLTWGEKPNFLFSVGGFHPDYTPPPLNLPDMKRLTINLLTGNNPRLTLSAYFALTSNTVQFGARAELYVKVAKVFGKTLSVEGFAGFDALFQFSPIYFLIRVEAGLSVIYGDSALLSIYLGGTLEGPAPWRIQGRAEFKVLGAKFPVKVDKTFGKNEKATLPDEEVEPQLVEALADSRNWMPELPTAHGGTVTLKETKVPDDIILADPVSQLGVTQKVVPTGVTITKFGHYKPSDSRTDWNLSLHNAAGTKLETNQHYEQFAPAHYFDKKDADKVSGKSFENMKAGIRGQAGDELSGSHFLERPVEYEETVYDGDSVEATPGKQGLSKAEFAQRLRGTAIRKSVLSAKPISSHAPAKVSVATTGYAVVSRSDQSIYEEVETSSAIEAALVLRQQTAADPQMSNHLQVMPATDLNQI